MARYQVTVQSHRPAAETFAYLATFSNAAERTPACSPVSSSAPARSGPALSSASWVLFLGLRMPLTHHVTSCQPGLTGHNCPIRRGAPRPGDTP